MTKKSRFCVRPYKPNKYLLSPVEPLFWFYHCHCRCHHQYSIIGKVQFKYIIFERNRNHMMFPVRLRAVGFIFQSRSANSRNIRWRGSCNAEKIRLGSSDSAGIIITLTSFLLATDLRQMKGGRRELKQEECWILRYHEGPHTKVSPRAERIACPFLNRCAP